MTNDGRIKLYLLSVQGTQFLGNNVLRFIIYKWTRVTLDVASTGKNVSRYNNFRIYAVLYL